MPTEDKYVQMDCTFAAGRGMGLGQGIIHFWKELQLQMTLFKW